MRMNPWFVLLIPVLFLPPAISLCELNPIKGPATGKIGDIAQIAVPEGFVFFEKKDMKELMEKTQNLYSDDQLGVLMNADSASGYWSLFTFDDIGYIKDAAKEKLDADAMWKQMVENSAAANQERKKKGWKAIDLVQWEVKPQYNPETQRLEWAMLLKEEGKEFTNYNTRILGRKGVMRVIVVPMGESNLAAIMPNFNQTISGFQYAQGNKYAEWTTGDKVADVGLAALVVGGAGALAAKTGLLGKLWALILAVILKLKVVIVVVLAAVAGFFKKLFGRGGDKTDDSQPPSAVVK